MKPIKSPISNRTVINVQAVYTKSYEQMQHKYIAAVLQIGFLKNKIEQDKDEKRVGWKSRVIDKYIIEYEYPKCMNKLTSWDFYLINWQKKKQNVQQTPELINN